MAVDTQYEDLLQRVPETGTRSLFGEFGLTGCRHHPAIKAPVAV
jgi:hypothetical protein